MSSTIDSYNSGAHAFALQNSRNDILRAYGIENEISIQTGEVVVAPV